jgi:hypothetical protein
MMKGNKKKRLGAIIKKEQRTIAKRIEGRVIKRAS